MSNTTYEAKENTPDGFRAVVVTHCDQGGGRVDFFTADDERHVISTADLAFLVRAAASLPRYVLEPEQMARVVSVPAVAEKPKEAEPVKTKSAGRRWSDEEEARLRGLYTAGNEVSKIADDMQRSPAAIISRLLAMNLIEVRPTANGKDS